MFLAIFPGDQVIEKKSTRVVVSILKATEDALGYYLENIGEPLYFRASNIDLWQDC
jgi:hypothetical protein